MQLDKRISALFVIDDPMNWAICDAYVETLLASTLAESDIVILYNLVEHKSREAETAIKARGAWILFLPAYSPGLSLIEIAFATLKSCLRTKAIRTMDQLWRAIGDICSLHPPTESQHYFKAAGDG